MFKYCIYLLDISSIQLDCGIRFCRTTKLIKVDPQLKVLILSVTELSTLKLSRIVLENSQIVIPGPKDNPTDFRRVQLIKKIFQLYINPDLIIAIEYALSKKSFKRLNMFLKQIVLVSKASLSTKKEIQYVSLSTTCFKLTVLPSLLLILYY